jgi:hypothetical protein
MYRIKTNTPPLRGGVFSSHYCNSSAWFAILTARRKRDGEDFMNANKEYKDGVFRTLFNDAKKLRKLYNAITGKNYGPDTEIELKTTADVFFGRRKNDIAFIIDGVLVVLIEHQSTLNKNMPLRMLFYIAFIYTAERMEIPSGFLDISIRVAPYAAQRQYVCTTEKC